jgi:hypothetical protein
MAQETSKPAAKQYGDSAARITSFVEDHVDSQILHEHSSVETSIHKHTTGMVAYLEDFEAAMKKG